MSQTSLERNCPICNSPSNEVMIRIDFELFEGHPMNVGYNVVQCDNCGFVYADTPVTQDELDKYYTELSKYEDKTIATGGGFTQNDKNRLADTALFISNNIAEKNARVLDLGCSNGGLLRELKELGFTNLVGIDPSLECVNITKEEVGCDCYQYSLFDVPESIGKFDVILFTHVLEHVLNVQETIAILSGMLTEKGVLYIECPNAAHYKDVIHAPFQEFNAEHINHFTETAFRNLMGANGFSTTVIDDKIFKIASDQDYHAVYGLFKKEKNNGYTIEFDTEIKEDINEYIAKSSYIFDEIKRTIAALPPQAPVALLGVGQFAFKLLKLPAFQSEREFKLFDNSPMNVGKVLNGVKIMQGSDILKEYKKGKFTIIISSLIHEQAIKKGIYDIFKANHEEAPEIVGFSHLL